MVMAAKEGVIRQLASDNFRRSFDGGEQTQKLLFFEIHPNTERFEKLRTKLAFPVPCGACSQPSDDNSDLIIQLDITYHHSLSDPLPVFILNVSIGRRDLHSRHCVS